ncbi:D-2-hydroxyacid dehydrogenase [Salinibaculum rarum]|uniref:D-2-hydroxyacid dehydrogenase n=1 Tax=Salinibaculum rarum TaxID=3058903 RepID=UPI0026605798|nr:D-2-hydroxyacid dehydrogenase [Salinibaculum sp. KK48]
MSDPDIVVLRRGVHGRPIESYVDAIRERLPDRDVRLARTPDEERELVASAPVVTGLKMDEELLAAAEELQLFACLYAGTGHLPLAAFEERDVAVTNASGVHGPNIAEYVVGSLLTFARGLHRGWEQTQRREWRHYQTRELKGSTVTVVGLGAIGETVVDRLATFDVETVGVRYTPEKGGPTDEVVGFEEIHEACARTDYLVLACPLTDATEHLVDQSVFETLPPEAVLVNVARGPVVDTDALVSALRGNDIRGAALDVSDPEPLPEDHPLWTLSNVLVTPHNSGDTPEYYQRVADILAENIARRDRGEKLRNRAV